MTAVLRWTHYAPDGLGVAVPRALAKVAADGAQGVDVATWRAFVLGTLGACANLGTSPVARAGEGDVVVRIAPSDRADKADWQRALGNALAALAASPDGRPVELAHDVDLTTRGGETASLSRPGVAGWPLVAFAAISVIAGVVAAAVAYVTAVDAEVKVREIERDSKKSALAATIAEASRVVEAHADREEAQGASIPYSQGELAWLQALSSATRDVTGWSPAPLQTTPDLRSISTAAAKAVEKVGSGVSIGLPIALIVGAALLAKD